MIRFTGKGVLLDIEGTVSSIGFVHDTMFPYVRSHLAGFLAAHGQDARVEAVCRQVLSEAGASSGNDVAAAVGRLMDADAKTAGLKELQGLVWQAGFESGELRSDIFDDVPPQLAQWHQAGIDVRIYSSGSVGAQKLFFRYSRHGDLTPLLKGFYDTRTGPKREAESYRKIAADMRLAPSQVLFLSDALGELDAARDAGMATGLVKRPGNPVVVGDGGYRGVGGLGEVGVP